LASVIFRLSRTNVHLGPKECKEVGGGRSPFVDVDKLEVEQEYDIDGAIVEGTVLDYLPPHPVLSNPRRQQRFLISVWKQPSNKLELNLEPFKSSEGKVPHQQSNWREREHELQFPLRRIETSARFAHQHGLELASLGFFVTGHDEHTSKIFTALGIHEPVFGKIRKGSESSLVSKISTVTELAKTLDDVEDYERLNVGKKVVKILTLPTATELKVGKVDAKQNRVSRKPRLNVMAQVGVVRSKEHEIAKDFHGAISSKLLQKRNRFENA
jgi:hypothetical protein